MLEKIYYNKLIIKELRQSVLGKYIDNFAFYLLDLGYSKKLLGARFTVIRKLSKWLMEKDISLCNLNEEQISHFTKIRKKQTSRFLQRGDGKTLSHFVDYLRSRGVIPQSLPVIPANESVVRIIEAYAKYLNEDKGLCTSTIVRNKIFICDFLDKQFGNNQFVAEKITQNIILTYIIKFKERHELQNLQRMVSALRSFLRYLVMIGEIRVELADCLPSTPSWRAANLPVFLVKSETKKLLKACDRRTPKGRRNYTILLLLLRLGLRASEVLNLTLDNINWDLGELDISGKGRKRRILPLPHDVGDTLAHYIRYVRPKCLDRHIFIRLRPPYRGLCNSSSISTIVRRALITAGLKPQQMGAHLLRYTVAMESLNNGSTLPTSGKSLSCSAGSQKIGVF